MKHLILYVLLLTIVPVFAYATPNQPAGEKEVLKKAQANIEKHRKADVNLVLKGNLDDVQVDVEQVSHDFLFGCIIFDLVSHGKAPENEHLFKERFSHLFNMAVFPFYWAGYESREGQTKQEQIKEVVQWCIDNGITCKGHPLAWTHTAGTPQWLSKYPVEKTEQLQMERIQTIVEQFDGQIDIWDVLNEAIHTVNWEKAMEENKAGQDNRYVGRYLMSEEVAFIDTCFRVAHRANPDAELILNEFGIVYDKELRQRFYSLVEKLQQNNSPVSALGIQAHEPWKGRVYYSPQQIWETLETYADFNLPLHLTELIPVSNGDSIMGGYKTGMWTEEAQAEFTEMIYTLGFGHPDVVSINWWGMSDANIWQEGGGLVDENLAPKPSYETLDRLINREWKTSLTGLKPTKKGQVSFRGFKGDYQVKAVKNGRVVKTWNVDGSRIKEGENIRLEM